MCALAKHYKYFLILGSNSALLQFTMSGPPPTEHAETPAIDESVPTGLPEAPAVPEGSDVAEPVGSGGVKRELEDAEERKAKMAKKWDESPSKTVISDCLMVWAEDKTLLNGEEILVLNHGAFLATNNDESLHVHTRCHTIEIIMFMW